MNERGTAPSQCAGRRSDSFKTAPAILGALPSPEHDPTGRDPSPAFEPIPYQRASHFTGERPTGRAYTAAQPVIDEAPDRDRSVYRLQLNQLWYVAALNLVPPVPVLRAIERILDRGEPAELPIDVWHALHERRRHAPGIVGRTPSAAG